jgi:hypothetical protein
LTHAFFLNGLAPYRKLKKADEDLRRSPYLELLTKTSQKMAGAWFDWAWDISRVESPDAFCREYVLDLIRYLICLKFREGHQPGAGVNATESGPRTYYPPVNARGAGVEVYRIYAGLRTPERRVLEDVLLRQAFFPDGPNAYGEWGAWNLTGRRWASSQLNIKISPQTAAAWLSWARETSVSMLGPDSCRGLILTMVRNLVLLKLVEPPLPGSDTNSSGKKPRSRGPKTNGRKGTP